GLLVTLALSACGAGATKDSSSAATSAAAQTSAATPTDPATTRTVSSQTSTTGASASTTHAHGRKRHQGNGLPPAPAGLAQTAGYGTYERCQGTCTGAAPAALRRPLRLPSADGGPCPITLNARPASTGTPS